MNAGDTWQTHRTFVRGATGTAFINDESQLPSLGSTVQGYESGSIETAVLDGFGVPRSTLPASGWSSGFNDNDDLQMTTFAIGLGLGLLPWNGVLPVPPFYVGNPFDKYYGNWCGLKNGGGEPEDAVDTCCEEHDDCLTTNPWIAAVLFGECNRAFCFCLMQAIVACLRQGAFRCAAAGYSMLGFACGLMSIGPPIRPILPMIGIKLNA